MHGTKTPYESVQSGLDGEATEIDSALKSFECMFNQDIIDLIISNTNIFIQSQQEKRSFVDRHAGETDETEAKSLLGLLILGGTLKSGKQVSKEFWNEDDIGTDLFKAIMSSGRFHMPKSGQYKYPS